MDSATLHLLLTEAKATAAELYDVRKPIVLSPGALHTIAESLLNLTDACEGLHHWGLSWMIAAARREPPHDVL
jgi:hypothetical protein